MEDSIQLSNRGRFGIAFGLLSGLTVCAILCYALFVQYLLRTSAPLSTDYYHKVSNVALSVDIGRIAPFVVNVALVVTQYLVSIIAILDGLPLILGVTAMWFSASRPRVRAQAIGGQSANRLLPSKAAFGIAIALAVAASVLFWGARGSPSAALEPFLRQFSFFAFAYTVLYFTRSSILARIHAFFVEFREPNPHEEWEALTGLPPGTLSLVGRAVGPQGKNQLAPLRVTHGEADPSRDSG